VAIVKESGSVLPFFSEDFYLTRALNPFYGTNEADRGTVSVKDLARSDLAKTNLDQYRILFLLNLKDLTAPEAEKVRNYLLSGGHIVIFPGDHADLKAYQRLEESNPPLLPARMMKVTGDAEARLRYMPLSKLDTSHPIFQALADMSNTALRSVHLYRYYELEVKPGSPGRALAKLGDGHLFLVEGSVGKGKVLFFCVSAGAQWSNLPVRNLFLPMVQQLIYYLAGGGELRTDHIVGSPVELTPRLNPKGFNLEVTDPLGQVKRLEPTVRGAEISFIYTDTDSLGSYTSQTDEKPPQTGIFVVNHDPQESDLSEFHQDELAALFQTTRIYFAPDAQQLDKAVTNLRQGFQLWNYLLLIVLAIAIVECILANKKKVAAPAPATSFTPAAGGSQ
jgi:hypothetical protein